MNKYTKEFIKYSKEIILYTPQLLYHSIEDDTIKLIYSRTHPKDKQWHILHNRCWTYQHQLQPPHQFYQIMYTQSNIMGGHFKPKTRQYQTQFDIISCSSLSRLNIVCKRYNQ